MEGEDGLHSITVQINYYLEKVEALMVNVVRIGAVLEQPARNIGAVFKIVRCDLKDVTAPASYAMHTLFSHEATDDGTVNVTSNFAKRIQIQL